MHASFDEKCHESLIKKAEDQLVVPGMQCS